jgi:hypothetical protein
MAQVVQYCKTYVHCRCCYCAAVGNKEFPTYNNTHNVQLSVPVPGIYCTQYSNIIYSYVLYCRKLRNLGQWVRPGFDAFGL